MTDDTGVIAVDESQSHTAPPDTAPGADEPGQALVEITPGKAPTFLLSHLHTSTTPEIARSFIANANTNLVVANSTSAAGNASEQCLAAKETILPEGWRLSGEIEVAGDLHIGGRLDGNVLQRTNDAVVKVEQSGRVIGGIVAQTIEIHGQFEGHLDASGGSVAIEQTARLNGKVSYATIRMNGGEHKIELVHVATPSAATED